MEYKEFQEEIAHRFLRFEEARSSIKSLMLTNIDGRRTYLQTLLLIIFVAAGFAINIKNDIGTASLVIGVSAYLICATFICIYLAYLLTKDGNFLDRHLNFINKEQDDLEKAIKEGKIKSEEDLEKFRANKEESELKFRKNNSKDVPDLYFWGINVLFVFATLELLIAYISQLFC